MSSAYPHPPEPIPAHVASHEAYLASIDLGYLGADFSQGLDGSLRLNAAVVMAYDLPPSELSDLEAAQVARNICTYTARRIELGMATTFGKPFVLQDGEHANSTHALLPEERAELGLEPDQTWVEIRKFVAERLVRDLGFYREELAEKPRGSRQLENVDAWLPIVKQISEEFGQEVFVTNGPRLLPGVEVIALQKPA